MDLVNMFVRIFLIQVLFLCHLASTTGRNISFDVVASSRNNLVIAAEKAVTDLNNLQRNVSFKINWLAASNSETDLSLFGNTLIERNTSIVFHASIPEKLLFLIPNILKMPMVGVWHHTCYKCIQGSVIGEYDVSFLPDAQEQIYLIKNISKALEWKIIGIIYEHGKYSQSITALTTELRKISLDVHIAALTQQENGTTLPLSESDIYEMSMAKPDGVIVLLEKTNTNAFFDYINSNSLQFKYLKLTFLLYSLTDIQYVTANKIHKVIALNVDVKENAEVQSLKALLNPLEYAGKDIGKAALMYDAVMSTGKVILGMIETNQWNATVGDVLQTGKERAARSIKFMNALEKFKDDGITGNIEFGVDGMRKKMQIKIMHLQENSFKKIGVFDKDGILTFQSLPKLNFEQGNQLKINGSLRIVTIHNPPFLNIRRSPNGTAIYDGILIDMINEMARIANFTYTLYEVADGFYGHTVNGKWVGLVGDLVQKKADMALATITITSKREEVVYFTKSYIEIKIGLISKRPEQTLLDLLQFMTPFTTTVWLMILTSCVGVGIILFSVDHLSPFGWRLHGERKNDEEGSELNLGNSLWFSIQSILLQGADNTPRSLSGRILVGCFWFYVLILTSSYTANLAAFFTSTKANEGELSLEALLKSGNEFATVKNYALEQYLKVSDYKVYNRIHERMVLQNGLAENTSDALEKVRKNVNLYYLEEMPFIKWVIHKKPCEFQMSETTLPETAWGFPVTKDSPYADAISYAVMKMLESGFIEDMQKSYEAKLFECSTSVDSGSVGITSDGRIEPLQMLGVYAFLIGGIVISVVLMIAENWWKKKVEERAARVKQRFKQSLRAFGSKKGDFNRIRQLAVKPKENSLAMSLVVSDLMKEKGEKAIFETE